MTNSSLDIDGVGPVPAPAPGPEPAAAAAPAASAAAPAAAASAATATLTLTPPEPVAQVAPDQAAGAVELDPAQTAALDEMVARFLEQITALDVHDEAFAAKVHDIQKLGDEDIRASAASRTACSTSRWPRWRRAASARPRGLEVAAVAAADRRGPRSGRSRATCSRRGSCSASSRSATG